MSSKEQDALNPYVALGELKKDVGLAPAGEGEETNPYVSLDPTSTGRTGMPVERGVGNRFLAGAGSGFVRPVRAFLNESDEDLGIAGAIGGMVGVLGAGVALYGGAGAVLKGVGLLRSASVLGREALLFTPLGRSGASLVAAQAARGAVAGAAFEAFSAETTEGAGQRALTGAVLGGGFDLAAAQIARAWRAGRTAWTPEAIDSLDQITIPTGNHNIHPLALKMEYAMRPSLNDTQEMVGAKLAALGDHKTQLHEAFVNMMQTHMPGGQAVLPGLSQREIGQLYKTADRVGGMKFAAFRRIKNEDMYDLLVVDTKRSMLKPDLLNGKASFEEMMAAVQKTYSDLTIELPGKIPSLFGETLGRYTPKMWAMNPLARVEVATQSTKFKSGVGVSTLLHEVVHHMEWRLAARRLGKDQSDAFFNKSAGGHWPLLEEMFKVDSVGADVIDTAARDAQLKIVREELDRATEEISTHWERFAYGAPNDTIARERAKKAIAGSPDYFQEDAERVSRMAELLLLDPKLARTVAPRASRLVGKMIAREAPEIRQLMSREAQIMLDLFTDLWRVQDGGMKTVFTTGRPEITQEMLTEFGKTGWAKGLRTMVNGKYAEYIGKAGDGKSAVRNLDTGIEEIIDNAQLSRPLLQEVATQDNKVLRAIDDLVAKTPRSMPINVTTALDGAPAIRRGLIDISNYVTLSGSVRDWVKSLPETLQERLIQKYGQMRPIEFDEIGPLSPELEFLKEAVQLMGYKGMIRNDDGLMRVFVVDESTQALSQVLESPKFMANVSGMEGALVFEVHPEEWLKHSLRIQGVAESDMDYFFNIAMNRLGKQLRQVIDADALRLQDQVMQELSKPMYVPKGLTSIDKPAEPSVGLHSAVQMDTNFGDTISQSTARAGVEIERRSDGLVAVRDTRTKSLIAIVENEDQAAAYVKDMGIDDGSPPLVPNFPGAISHGGNALPPKPNNPIFPAQPPIDKNGRLQGVETFFGSWTTALENFAKRLENTGMGPAYTVVYRRAHEAMLQVQRELSVVKRDALGGLTFGDKLTEISQGLVKIPAKRYPLLSGYIEALSKEEISQAGGLMKRAMSARELDVAQRIEGMGLGHDIPRLMSGNRLVDASISGKLESVIERMRAMKLSPEAEGLLAQFEAMPMFKTRDEVMNYLGWTDEEKAVSQLIRDSMAVNNKDEFSIYAVSRYASAPRLKAGFKDGREMFAAQHKMTDREMTVTRFMEEALQAGFLDSGLDAKRHLSGYFPHLRVWVQEGFHPSGEFLPPDVLEWVANRYRSGELNVFDTDPLSVVYRHLRSLYMKRHFDPIMPDVNKALGTIKRADDRAGEVMQEYVLELIGKPHDSFGRLQGAMSHMMKTMFGKAAPDRLANDVVSALSALTSAAVIPFRPALVFRNFVESALKIAPRTGIKHYLKGLTYVTNADTKREAFLQAMKAGAIRPGTQKLRSYHSAEELFGANAPNTVSKFLHIFDKGFEWYQSADDWGRAVAFHAQRLRIMDHLDDYVKGHITIGEFKSRAKINTFDPLDRQIAEREILAGNYEKATNHLGQVLSREAMTRYGYADHPAGWNSVQGRIFGQFGTWPVQYKDYIVQGMTRGSMKDRAEFLAIHGGISGAIVASGAAVGLNLGNWTGSFMYTGGPFLDMAIDVQKSLSGGDAEKALARRNLYAQIPILGWMETGNPRSVFLPGSYLLGDLSEAKAAMEDQGIFESVLTGGGFKVMRPRTDLSPLELIFGPER